MNRIGIVQDPLYLQHDAGAYHPECPERLEAIYARLSDSDIVEELSSIQARVAQKEEICWVHSQDYYDFVASSDGKFMSLDPDTQAAPDSYRAAKLAVGAGLVLVEKVVAGELDGGFALVRPPGHHAEHAQARGFCLFNNIAVAAELARKKLGLERILIVDWDLHHGNGTMHSFNDRQDILYFSTHQYPFYPGTGSLHDKGTGIGQGYTVSVPLPIGMGDGDYAALFEHILQPISNQFAPELILVSAGFDTLATDPLGSMRMTTAGYTTLMKQIMDMAKVSAQGRIVLFLEGGYDVQGEARAVEAVLRTMLTGQAASQEEPTSQHTQTIIQAIQQKQSPYWSF